MRVVRWGSMIVSPRATRRTGGHVIHLRVLEDIAPRAVLDRLEHLRVLALHGQDDHPGIGSPLEHAARRLGARHGRHVEVHQHDVRLDLGAPRDGARAVITDADDLDIRLLLDHPTQAFHEHAMVIDHQHTGWQSRLSLVTSRRPSAGRHDDGRRRQTGRTGGRRTRSLTCARAGPARPGAEAPDRQDPASRGAIHT